MGIGTLLRFLIGDRQAILDIAADRRAVWIGLLFVISAAFARDYDGEDLLSEPWHLLIPVGASLLSSFVLFVLCFLRLLGTTSERPRFFSAYRSFLSLFWMTAPLAWLYAIPYERFLSPGGAMQANLTTLGLVAAWRVVLMIRVVIVLMGYRPLQAILLVMTFADAAALAAIYAMPKPVFNIMGGVRQSESEAAVLVLTIYTTCIGVASIPVWLIGTITVLSTSTPSWRGGNSAPATSIRGALALAVASVAVWALVLPTTQAEQRLRYQAENDLRAGRIAEALDLMSAHVPADFPPQWEPPPRLGYGERVPPFWDVLVIVADRPPAPWVRELYIDKLNQILGNRYVFYQPDAEAVIEKWPSLHRLPEWPMLVARHSDVFRELLEPRHNMPPETADELTDMLGNPRTPPGPP
jgi:hypothetical protein